VKRLSVYFPGPLAAELREEELPALQPGEALVETVVSAISSGTEMLIYRGQAPEDMAVDETIAALGGKLGFPIKFGYAAAGRVIDMGPGLSPDERLFWLGRQVFAFNPHESHFIASLADLNPLPDDISPEAAVFLPNMETAVSFVMDGRPVIGEHVVVLGQGVVGLLTTALLAEMPLSNLMALDAYPLRREWSTRLGASAVFDVMIPGMVDQVRQLLPETLPFPGADLTYELSGNPRALDTAIALTGFNGRILIGSWYGSKPVKVDLGGRFHRAHMNLISSQVSTLNPQWSGRWTKARRLDVAWDMVRRHRPERLVTHRLPVTEAAAAYQLLAEHAEDTIQVIFTYST
jgi:2-desacetyl-2-hydroxyethyl bacteriochlorophyllide A dehydrogenase